jgi:HTH-like domain/Integrase core domain
MLMRRIDELFTARPFLGSRRLMVLLRAEEYSINRKRVHRLMRRMGISALAPRPKTTKPAPGHKIFPYLVIDRPNQVWAADVTYIPIGRGFLYLVVIIDWASRAVLSWRLSNGARCDAGARGAAVGRGSSPIRPQVFVVGDRALIDLVNLVEGAVGEFDPIVADRKPPIGVVENSDVLADRCLSRLARLQNEDHLVVLQCQRLREAALFFPGRRVLQIVTGAQRRCKSFLFAGGLAKRALCSSTSPPVMWAA